MEFLAGEAGPEYVSVTPKNQIGGSHGGAGGGEGMIINLTLPIEGNEIVNTRKLHKVIRLQVGQNRDKYG